jgi:integrase
MRYEQWSKSERCWGGVRRQIRIRLSNGFRDASLLPKQIIGPFAAPDALWLAIGVWPLRGLHRQRVFPSPQGPEGRLSNPHRFQWSPHAHRRTFAIVAMEAGVFEEVVGRLLNHTPLSITGQRYAKPSLDALRPALETVC